MTEVRPSVEQTPQPRLPEAAVNVVPLPREQSPRAAFRRMAIFWRRYAPLLLAAALSVAWLATAYDLGWSDPASIAAPLLLPWLVAAVYLLSNPGRHTRIDLASGLAHTLGPVEAAEARISTLIAKLDKRMETIAAVGEVAGDRFENMARTFERQMNDMFNAATAVEKIATKVDVQLRDGVKGLTEMKEAFSRDSAAVATQLTALIDALNQAAVDAMTHIGSSSTTLHQEVDHLREVLTITTTDSGRLALTLKELDQSFSSISASIRHDAQEMTQLGEEAEKAMAASLLKLNDAIFAVRESLAASDQQLAATRKVYEAVLQEMSVAQVSTRQRQRKEAADAASPT